MNLIELLKSINPIKALKALKTINPSIASFLPTKSAVPYKPIVSQIDRSLGGLKKPKFQFSNPPLYYGLTHSGADKGHYKSRSKELLLLNTLASNLSFIQNEHNLHFKKETEKNNGTYSAKKGKFLFFQSFIIAALYSLEEKKKAFNHPSSNEEPNKPFSAENSEDNFNIFEEKVKFVRSVNRFLDQWERIINKVYSDYLICNPPDQQKIVFRRLTLNTVDEAMTTAPDSPLNELDLLSPDEENKLVEQIKEIQFSLRTFNLLSNFLQIHNFSTKVANQLSFLISDNNQPPIKQSSLRFDEFQHQMKNDFLANIFSLFFKIIEPSEQIAYIKHLAEHIKNSAEKALEKYEAHKEHQWVNNLSQKLHTEMRESENLKKPTKERGDQPEHKTHSDLSMHKQKESQKNPDDKKPSWLPNVVARWHQEGNIEKQLVKDLIEDWNRENRGFKP